MSRDLKRTLLCWGCLSPLMIVILFPYATILFTALKRRDELFQFEVSWLPDSLYLGNFVDLLVNRGFGRAIRNSL